MKIMNIYENNKELLSILGVEGNYNTDFEVRKAILNALGGDASNCNSIYEVDLQILKIYQEGGGGSSNFVLDNGTKLAYSTWSEVPSKYDFSEITDYSYMFGHCSNLTDIPQIDVSKGNNFGSMFSGCPNLTTIPQLDTSNGTYFGWMFEGCSNLTAVSQLDVSGVKNAMLSINLGYMFRNCNNLENITFVGSINANIDFSPCTKLTYESVKSILTACSNTTNTNAKTLKFNVTLTDQNSELQSLVDICTSKGWTISGLTLN